MASSKNVDAGEDSDDMYNLTPDEEKKCETAF